MPGDSETAPGCWSVNCRRSRSQRRRRRSGGIPDLLAAQATRAVIEQEQTGILAAFLEVGRTDNYNYNIVLNKIVQRLKMATNGIMGTGAVIEQEQTGILAAFLEVGGIDNS